MFINTWSVGMFCFAGDVFKTLCGSLQRTSAPMYDPLHNSAQLTITPNHPTGPLALYPPLLHVTCPWSCAWMNGLLPDLYMPSSTCSKPLKLSCHYTSFHLCTMETGTGCEVPADAWLSWPPKKLQREAQVVYCQRSSRVAMGAEQGWYGGIHALAEHRSKQVLKPLIGASQYQILKRSIICVHQPYPNKSFELVLCLQMILQHV